MTVVADGGTFRAAIMDGLDARTRSIIERRGQLAKRRGRGWLIRRMLLLADVVGLALAFLVADLIFGSYGGPGEVSLHVEFLLFTVGAWLFVLGALATGVAHPALAKLAGFWALALLLITGGRALARASC